MLRRILFSIIIAAAVATPAAARRSRAHAGAAPIACISFYLDGRAPASVAAGVPAGQVFCHMIYSVSYSVARLNPLWSAEHLTRAAAVGGDNTFRSTRSSFQQQPGLTRSQQAANRDFAHNEWDLGHMAPANDAPNDASQEDTFFLVNVVPQEDNLNRVLWAHLEASVHQLAKDEGEVYIVTGPIFGAHPLPMNRRVPIPDFTFKAIFIPSLGQAVGFIARNNQSAICQMVPVAEITRQSGIDPFPSLPASVKAARPTLTLPEGHNFQKDGSSQTVPVPECPPAP